MGVMMQHLTQSSSGGGSSSSSWNNNALSPPTASTGTTQAHNKTSSTAPTTTATTATPSRLDAPSLDLLQHRPKSSPARQSHSHSASSSPATSSFDFNVPRIAIFREAFSFQSLRQRARFHKSSTPSTPLGDLSSSSYTKRQLSSTSLNSSPNLSLTSPTTYSTESHSHSETRLPSAKRPPASWSSHGIETSFGPPPALITRGSYNSDLARRAQSPAAAALTQQKHKPYNITTPAKDTPTLTKQDSFINSNTHDATFDAASSPLSPKLLNPSDSPSLDAMMDRNSTRSAANSYLDDGASAYTDAPSQVLDGPSGGDAEDSGRSAEDLFLNLAEDIPADTRQYDTQSRLERRTVGLLFAQLES
jgi:hypothetical protein